MVRKETNRLVTDLVNLDRVRSLLEMLLVRRKYLALRKLKKASMSSPFRGQLTALTSPKLMCLLLSWKSCQALRPLPLEIYLLRFMTSRPLPLYLGAL